MIDGVWRFEDVADAQMHMHNRKNKGSSAGLLPQ
ncbi:MAG: hypothetical protein Ct9H90mP24_4210 [Methanobacteriota archaeon]|nr:MAG: hypothetical protein Ct9H90mP24_4210 [Euryarchaeota archaeon]